MTEGSAAIISFNARKSAPRAAKPDRGSSEGGGEKKGRARKTAAAKARVHAAPERREKPEAVLLRAVRDPAKRLLGRKR